MIYLTPIVLVYASLRSGQTEVYQTSCPPRQARTHKSRKIYHEIILFTVSDTYYNMILENMLHISKTFITFLCNFFAVYLAFFYDKLINRLLERFSDILKIAKSVILRFRKHTLDNIHLL